MELPFSDEQFFAVFGAYNTALWPFVITLWALSAGTFIVVLRGGSSGRAVTALLASHWAWSGVAYHWLYFTAINSAAFGFAAAFGLQAALLTATAWRAPPRYAWRRAPGPALGAGLAAYGLLYPMVAWLSVGGYPLVPTFGVPCPTTLFTIGLLLMATPGPTWLLAIPALWAFVGGSAAVIFGVTPDYALLAAGILAVVAVIASVVHLPHGMATTGPVREPPSPSGLAEPDVGADFRCLATLPAPVAGYLRRTLTDRQPVIRAVYMRQEGVLRTGLASARWRKFSAEQRIVPPARSFVWHASVRMPLGLSLRVRDGYAAGVGSGRVSLMSFIPIASETGRPELASGGLHRFLAEAVWYPTALLPQSGVVWRPFDDATALATLSDHGVTVTLEFRFDDAGDVTGVYTPGRYGRFHGGYRRVPWEGRFGNHREIAGLRVPTYGEVGWHDGNALQLVWKGHVTHLELE